MNLEIMSLMAASAAVSDGTTAPAQSADPLASLTADSTKADSFSTILQELASSLENSSDITTEQIEDLPGAQGASAETLIQELTNENPEEAQVAISSLQSGEALPSRGNTLPQIASPESTQPGLAEDASTIAGTIDAAQAATNPVASGVTSALLADGGPEQTLNAQTNSSLQRFGWFSQRPGAAANSVAIPTTGDTAAALQTGRETGAPAPPTPALTVERPDPALTGAPVDAKPALLARQLQRLTTQSASVGPSVSALESAGNDMPRGTLATPLSANVPSSPLSTSTLPSFPDALSTALNLNQAGWDKALGQRLVFMAANGMDSAELRLDPPQLGKVHVKLSIQSDQAQVMLQAANPLARDAMETALPRLREMLGAEGLQLESAQVTDRNDADRQRQARDQQEAQPDHRDDDSNPPAEADASLANVETLTAGSGVISERV